MSSRLRPYPSVKNAGVPWLGQVPAHWDVHKLRHVLRRYTERNRPDLPLLSVVRERGVIRRDTASTEENHNFIPDDLSNYKVVRAGQFAVNKMKAWQGSYGVSSCDGIVSPAYFVFDVLGLDTEFFHAAVRSRVYAPIFARASDGVRIGQWDLVEARMREIPFLVPPRREQATIVRFLDHTDGRIRRYIQTRQKLIALLEEQTQVIIHEAVTGQIDVRKGRPYSTYKPAGVGWLRDVPTQWDDVTLGVAVQSIQTGPFGSQLHSEEYVTGGIPVVNPSHLMHGRIRPELSVSITRKKARELSRHRLRLHDIVMARRGEVGRCALVTEVEAGWICGTGSIRIRPRSEHFSSDYLIQLLNASRIRDVLSRAAIGATMDNLNPRKVARLRLPHPPLVHQADIVKWLRRRTAATGELTDGLRRQIAAVQEYRTRLVADVVTGRVDVREVAAKLPKVGPLAGDEILRGGKESHDARDPRMEVVVAGRNEFERRARDARGGRECSEVGR